MSLTAAFKANASLERQGVRVEVATNDGIPESDPRYWIWFTLCRAGRNNPDYQKIAERIMRPYRRAQELGTLGSAKLSELSREIFAEAAVTGWGNVPKSDVTGISADAYEADTAGAAVIEELPDGSKIKKPQFAEYSKANCIALFKNLPELYDKLVALSIEHTTFTDGNMEEDGKNSQKS